MIKSLWRPFDVHIDQQEISSVLPTWVSLGRSARNLSPRTAATLKSRPSNEINGITKEELMHDP